VEIIISALGQAVPETLRNLGVAAVAEEQVGQVRIAAVEAIGSVGVGYSESVGLACLQISQVLQ